MLFGSDPQELVILCVVMVISLTFHELAHARTALAFGDDTAKLMGRVTLNPIKHLDLMGSICFMLAGIGWAKPVPVNPYNLHPKRLGNFLVSLAGPMANIGLAAISAVAFRLMATGGGPAQGNQLANFVYSGLLPQMIVLNVALALFNLIPLFPLDGHHLQREVLPGVLQGPFMQWQMRFGPMVLLAIMIVPRLLQVPGPLTYYFEYVGYPIIRMLIGP